jgi:hypothetical protein
MIPRTVLLSYGRDYGIASASRLASVPKRCKEREREREREREGEQRYLLFLQTTRGIRNRVMLREHIEAEG